MRATSKLLALALTATMQSAMAGAVFLDFEDLQTTAALTTRYSALGVVASGDSWGATSAACNYGPNNTPGKVSFFRDSSCGALYLAQDPTKPVGVGASLTLDLAGGFVDTLSFVYAGSVGAPHFSIHVYDAAGNDLGGGLDNQTAASCDTLVFCNWINAKLDFTGVARKVVFSADDQTILLDDISFKTADAPGRLPEPTSVALALGALAGLGWTRRRAAR